MNDETRPIVVIVPTDVRTDDEYQSWWTTLSAARALADLMAFLGQDPEVASDLAASHYTDKKDAAGWTDAFLDLNTEAVLTWLCAQEGVR